MGWTRIALVLIACFTGVSLGLGFYTFIYAKGASYLTDDPAACANCHVMTEQYDGWVKSSHRLVAVCNDCHTPEGPVSKYVTKASNGFWHSFGFTTGRFPEPIRIKESNRTVANESCRKCHAGVAHAIESGAGRQNDLQCTHCHSSVGHL